MIVHGRTDRCESYNKLPIRVMQQIDKNNIVEKSRITEAEDSDSDAEQQEAPVAMCLFCDESPAIKIMSCGKCKKATYCSVGCQKSHWKVHKTSCR